MPLQSKQPKSNNKKGALLKTQWVGSLAYAELRYEGRGREK
jgi:hypothetical protein